MEAVPVETPKQERPVWKIIVSVAAIVLCGLVGLCLLCPASILIFTGTAQSSTDSYFANTWGILPLCLSVLFIAIGVVVPILLLRKPKPTVEELPPTPPAPPMPPQEPLPPAS